MRARSARRCSPRCATSTRCRRSRQERGWYFEHSRMSAPQSKAITRAVNRLCGELREHARARGRVRHPRVAARLRSRGANCPAGSSRRNRRTRSRTPTSASDTETIIVISSTLSRRLVVRSPRMLLSHGARNCTSESCPSRARIRGRARTAACRRSPSSSGCDDQQHVRAERGLRAVDHLRHGVDPAHRDPDPEEHAAHRHQERSGTSATGVVRIVCQTLRGGRSDVPSCTAAFPMLIDVPTSEAGETG